MNTGEPMQSAGGKTSAGRAEPAAGVLFPNLYAWFVLVSALDVMLTWVILHLGGSEANGLAARVIERFGLPGMCLFKFALVSVVIGICEIVGRRNRNLAERLIVWGIAITCVPVILSMLMIRRH